MTEQLQSDDFIRPFQLDKLGLRGRLVRLGPTSDEILRRHGYPDPICHLLGEALALTAALAGALKFDGVFTLQTSGDGPAKMLVADFVSPGRLRAYAQLDRERLADHLQQNGNSPDMKSLLGKGYIAFTVDQGEDMERYQGIVELAGDNLSDCANRYFAESEQIETAIRLAAGEVEVDGRKQWRAGAIMVQRLPEGDPALMARGAEFERSEASDDDWHRVGILLNSARDDELLSSSLGADDLLFRLFHEDGVRVFDQQPLEFGCRCSSERAVNVLSGLPQDQLQEMAIDGRIFVTCEFCNSVYDFRESQFTSE